MANLRDEIDIDVENINRVFAEMPNYKMLHQLSNLELAGVATLLHNFYNGAENLLSEFLSIRGFSFLKEVLGIKNY